MFFRNSHTDRSERRFNQVASRRRKGLVRRALTLEPLEERQLLAIDFTAGAFVAPTNRADVGLGTLGGFAPIEPAISVNPTDPGNVVVTSHIGLRSSTNAGVTFAATDTFANVPGQTGNSGDTDTAFDSQGRLFWVNLVSFGGQRDVVVEEVDPVTGNAIATPVRIPNGGFGDDKPFIGADSNPDSPFADNIYVAWSRFGQAVAGEWSVYVSRSTDHGATWSTPLLLSDFDGPNNVVDGGGDDEGFTWPADVKVAPNGDVYVSYHAQPDINDAELEGGTPANPNGTSGKIFVLRSTDGGQTFTQKTEAFDDGQADVTYNRQSAAGLIPGTDFWTVGSPQPWVLPDPTRPGFVYIVSNDDPNNTPGNGDDGDIVFARSGDNGQNWIRSTISAGPANSFQIFPTASIDAAGNIVVAWYDNRRGLTNAGGNFLLDFMARYSTDGGLTWSPEFLVSDAASALDPDIGAATRFNDGGVLTTRIGEYMAIEHVGGTAHAAWNGPTPLGGGQTGQQVVYGSFAISGSLTVTGDDSGAPTDDVILIQRSAADANFIEVFVNGDRQYAGLLEGLTRIDVLGLGGADQLIVDSTNGLISLADGINFDGGAGFDRLDLQQTGGPTRTSSQVNVGALPGSGQSVIDGQVVNFQNIEPVTDNVPATTFTLSSVPGIATLLDASNAINYTVGQILPNSGRITVDNFEPVEFSNKANLVIDSGAGDDTINLHYNSTTNPTGLTGITVSGEDPTASDTLIVNGIDGTLDNLRYRPTAVGAGTVINDSAPQPDVSFSGIEHLILVVQQADADGVRVDGTTGNDAIEFFHGLTSDSGSFVGTMDQNNATEVGPFTMTAMSYHGILPSANDTDVNFFGAGGTDSFVFNGTANDDSILISTGEAGGSQFQNTLNGIVVARLEVFNVASGLVRALAGNDAIAINTPAGPVAAALRVEGGDSDSSSDVINYTAPTGVATTINLAAGTITSPGANPVTFTGTERINVISSGGGSTLAILGTAGPDDLSVTPTGATSGTITGLGPIINFTGVGGTFSVDLLGGGDNLAVYATQSGETVTVNSTTVVSTTSAFKTVTYSAANTENLQIFGLAGNDIIDVTPSATTTIFVDGGDPIGNGNTPADEIVLHPTGLFLIEPGPESDEGGLFNPPNERVSWDHIERVTAVNGGGPMLILGTNGDDDITIIARDDSYSPLADGVQDFTVSVNDGPEVLYIDQPILFVDALAGDDDIVVREPAPNNAVWNVQVYVAGGTPAVAADSLGDILSLETPGTQTVIYSPQPALADIPPVPFVTFPTPSPIDTFMFHDTTNTSHIVATPFSINVVDLFVYNSSPGGVEQAVYQGMGGNDPLTFNTPLNATGNDVTYTPGAVADAGLIEAASVGGTGLVPLRFAGLGATATITFTNANTNPNGRVDTLDVKGTAAGERFNVNGPGNAGAGTVQLLNAAPNNNPETVLLNTNAISILSLLGLGGIDTFNLTGALPYTNVIINADATLNLAGAVGPVTVNIGDNTPGSANPDTVITGYGAPVVLIGVDTANLDANGQTMTATGTTQNDNIIYTPTGATAGTFYDEIGSGNNLVPNTVFNIANVSGNFRVFNDPAGNADQVTLRGTAARDLIQINQSNGVAQVLANNVTALLPVQLGISAEILNALGLGGQDTFQVIPAAGIGGQAQDNLLINVDGGASGENNALVIASTFGAAPALLPATSFVVVNRGRTPDTGTVRVFQSAVANPDVNYKSVQVVSPLVVGGSVTPNSLFIGPDNFEQNDQLGNAAFLGADSTLQVQHASVFPNNTEFVGVPADEDFYRVVTQTTGTLDFQVYFRTFSAALLPGGGQINLQLFDVDGTLIAAAPGVFGANPGTGNARIRIPAVEGQTYFLRVVGATVDVVNGYDITVIDTPPPVPFDLELDDVAINSIPNPPGGGPNSDTGRSQFDNVTYDNTPTLFFRLNDAFFLNDLPGNDIPDSPPAGVIPIPFRSGPFLGLPGYAIAIFDEGPGTVGATPPQTPLGFAFNVGDLNSDGDTADLGEAFVPGVYKFTTPILTDGSHFLSARVQMIDPATPTQTGFGARSVSLEIIVDTDPPLVSFGQPLQSGDGLLPDSDSGVSPPNEDTLIDLITNDVTPSFWGRAEANTIIRLFVDHPVLGTPGVLDPFDVFIGQDTAIPLDGTNQEPDGYWEIDSVISFNDPTIFPVIPPNTVPDGIRTVFVTAEDLAGNLNAPGDAVGSDLDEILDIFIDTQGPRINEVEITDYPDYDLFNPKGPLANIQGPTPVTQRITIHFTDLPFRDAPDFLFVALKPETVITDHFQVFGDQVGRIAIDQVILNQVLPADGQPATATVTLVFEDPLPDDRFTLVVTDDVRDIAGNRLDGETDAAEPQEDPRFPSGDGIPGGDFIARFTIDTRPELGVYAGIRVYVDLNGNFVFDPEGQDNDAVNRDIVFRFGSTSDSVFAGQFVSPGPPLTNVPLPPAPEVAGRFFDQIAAYGNVLGAFRFVFDFNSDGVADLVTTQNPGFQIDGVPVAGNFDLDFTNGDEVALFTGTQWFLDTNHNFEIDGADTVINSAIRGFPQVGDIDGDTLDDLVTFQNDTFFIDFASNGYGQLDESIPLALEGGGLGFPGVSERPTVADMNQDGIDDIGVWVPGNLGQTVGEISEFYFLVSQIPPNPDIPFIVTHVPGTPIPAAIPGTLWAFPESVVPGSSSPPTAFFQPVPFGTSLFAIFGDEPAFPIVGNFDPPVGTDNVGEGPGSDGTLDNNRIVVASKGAGSDPKVVVYDRDSGAVVMEIMAYNPAFRGGVQVATADVNGDGTVDIITAPGRGNAPLIRIFDGRTGQSIRDFFAYDPNFTGGVFIAVGDFDADDRADIVTAPAKGGGPQIRVFSGADGHRMANFFAYDKAFTGGVHVAVGNTDGVGHPEIITAPDRGGGPQVRTFNLAGQRLNQIIAYDAKFTGGVFVAAGDVDGDQRADIITGAGAGGGPQVRVFSGADSHRMASFFAYANSFFGGVRVASGDFDGDGRADIYTGPGAGGGPQVRVFDGDNLNRVANFFAFPESFVGGVFVAAPAATGAPALHAFFAGAGGAALSQSDLDAVVAVAISQLEQADVLSQIPIRIVDLPGTYLGLAYRDEILIDVDAAGHGWSSEGIDLLSVLAHELGHVLGHDHSEDEGDLMSTTLGPGESLDGLGAVDAVFAELS